MANRKESQMPSVTEVFRDETTVYGVVFTVCENDEVLSDRLACGGNFDPAVLAEAVSATYSVLRNEGYDYERETNFRVYNGGPRKRLIEADWFVAELSEIDGEEDRGEWHAVWTTGAGATVIPAEAIDKADAVSDKAYAAMDKVVKAELADMASREA